MGAARAAVSPAECSLATLGSFEWQIRGQVLPNPATQKARALLTYLTLHRRSDVARERLIEIFWPDSEPERARDSLNTALHSIRRALRTAGLNPDAFVFANRSVIRWKGEVDLDVERLERALQSEDAGAVRDALTHYPGDFLEGDYDDWTVAERERIAEQYERLLAQAVRSTGEPDVAKKLLARNPYDEDAYSALIDAELAAGRYFSAAQIVRQCYAALEEIGVKPSADFAKRFKEIEQRPAQAANKAIDVPFVGRDAEFTDLTEIVDRVKSDLPCVALLEGEPGIGKSALLDRVLQHAASRGLRVVSTRAVCDDPRAFGIWPQLYVSLTGKDFATFIARTTGNAAAELGLAILRDIPNAAVLAVDDAQYLSDDALQTLAALAKHAAAERSHVVVISTRPEGCARIGGRLHETHHAVVHLGSLSDEEMRTAIALAGVDLDVPALQLLGKRARGHPLYLKGLLEQLVRSSALRAEGKRWRLAQPEFQLDLPPSLRRLIENRIRGRGTDAIAVASALAVEPTAGSEEVCAATGLSQLAVLDALDDLLGYHIIAESAAGPRHFVFTHDLLEETARNMLPSARRAQLHGAFARVLSESNVRGRDIRRAMHLEAAGVWEKAAAAYLDAAHESAESQAPYATLERTESGLRCLTDLLDSPQVAYLHSVLYQTQFFAHRLLWQLDACKRDAQKAVDYARVSDDPRCLVRALSALRSAITIGEMDQSEQLQVVRELSILSERLGDRDLAVQCLIDEGHTYRLNFFPDDAERCLRRAFALARESGRPELVAKAAVQLLSLQACWWRFDGAAEVIAAVKEIENALEWPFRAHTALASALLWGEAGHYDRAAAELRSVDKILANAMFKQEKSQPYVPRPEIAIRLDYFRASLDGRREHWEGGLAAIERHRSMYEALLHEARYRDLFTSAKIDLLLGRNKPGDGDVANDLLEGVDPTWNPETGFQPYHAFAVTIARVRAFKRSAQAADLLESALDFLDAEADRWPFGLDVAFSRVAGAAAEAEESELALRAGESAACYRAQRTTAARDLVCV